MFFSLLSNFFVTMYIFLSADGKIAYLYDEVFIICSSDYIFYTRNTFIATPREGVNNSFRNKLKPANRKKKGYKKKNGVKIIIFKAFRLKSLFSVRNWWSCIYQEFKDIFKENKQSFEGKSRTLTQFITFKEYTCMADKAFTALYSIWLHTIILGYC